MTRRWESVLDDQLELFSFHQSDFGRRFIDGFSQSVVSSSLAELELVGGEPLTTAADAESVTGFFTHLYDYLQVMIWNAEPIYIDPDMMTLVEAASATFQPEPLQAGDLLVPNGFLALPRPFQMLDRRGKIVSIRYFAWYPTAFTKRRDLVDDGENARGIVLALFSHVADPDGYTGTELDASEQAKYIGGRILLTHIMPWGFGLPYGQTAGGQALAEIAQFLQCLWRLMAQTITVRSKEQASRTTRRRLEKVRFPDKSITVIRLRRPHTMPADDHEPHAVDWQSRWIVSGHWRNQWFASLNTHRQIWISPYIKGPEDKPLEVRKLRVFEFVQ